MTVLGNRSHPDETTGAQPVGNDTQPKHEKGSSESLFSPCCQRGDQQLSRFDVISVKSMICLERCLRVPVCIDAQLALCPQHPVK
jgi:hypothetical protein